MSLRVTLGNGNPEFLTSKPEQFQISRLIRHEIEAGGRSFHFTGLVGFDGGCLPTPMHGNSENVLLKGVSRSFYLTLRLLPAPMRGAASLAYLLARTSDTLADTVDVSLAMRLECLDSFERSLFAGKGAPAWPTEMMSGVGDPAEHLLLERSGDLFDWLARVSLEEAELIREVVGIIISGQKLDLERFAEADEGHPLALVDDAELEDYAWRVAGCVGAFWTKLGFLTLGNRFSKAPEPLLIEQGIAYGKGLQLVNILRDVPVDLAAGRCYLPVAAPQDSSALLDEHGRWVERAAVWNGAGFSYAETLCSRRLRAATVLPAMIARDTLERLRGADWATLRARVKVPRSSVYCSVLRAFAGCIG